MRYEWRDLPALLGTPLGRLRLLDDTINGAWPALRGIAGLYRRTLIRASRVVAVVGSFGKTTTARAVVTALGGIPHRFLVLNGRAMVPLAIFRVRPGQRHAVLEVAVTGPGQMAKHARMVRPDIVVVTSVGSEHNRSLKTLEATRAEKAEMVRILPASGWAVLNGDDPNVRWMADQTCARVVTFGFGETNDVRATDPVLDWPHGTRFTLHTPVGTRRVRVRLIGRPMIYPVLAAVAVALSQERPLDRVLPALESLEPTPGRLQPVALHNGAFLLRDDFKSAQETIEAALDVLENIPAPRRIVVLGGVSEPFGSQGPIYRHLGARVARVADWAIFLAEYQRYAAEATRAGLPRGMQINAEGDLRKAVEALRTQLRPGDVVLLKGRDTERVGRIALALMGWTVRCELKQCGVRLSACHKCPMLERGWEGRRVVF